MRKFSILIICGLIWAVTTAAVRAADEDPEVVRLRQHGAELEKQN